MTAEGTPTDTPLDTPLGTGPDTAPHTAHDTAHDTVLGVLWEDVEVFRAVAAVLSFTAAAERLHPGRPVVSRRVQRLERAVRTPLSRARPGGWS